MLLLYRPAHINRDIYPRAEVDGSGCEDFYILQNSVAGFSSCFETAINQDPVYVLKDGSIQALSNSPFAAHTANHSQPLMPVDTLLAY